ncbi:MATE family efflux transporter [Mycoplasma phocoenae]|uniref:Multidrug transporter MATE n=1 Tax=Mycoplasma phocoenae TaxID=754517 RepID=A0A858U3X7_9MOLU|nr:MATE family efflux transporter [Mycoplasma phocoenae]QJG66759.1 multidrug transporter MATE [Mycoplasma phocoenae]
MKVKNKGQSRAIQLFEKTPIKKAIFIVALPGLLSMLMMGLYSFFNQVFILNFVPKTIALFNDDLSGVQGNIYTYLREGTPIISHSTFNEMWKTYNSFVQPDSRISQISSDIVSSISINATIPFMLFGNALALLIPVGASVYYTKCISKKVENTAKNLFAMSFWTTLTLTLFSTFIILLAIWTNLTGLITSHTKFDTNALIMLDNTANWTNVANSKVFVEYYKASHDISTAWANSYLYCFAICAAVQGMYLLLSFFIRAEGKNSYVMIWAIIANLVGLALDAVFIIVFRLGILGGALATLVGWTINLFAYFIYVLINSKNGDTWISFKELIKFKMDWQILMPIMLLGISAFVRTLGVAVLNLVVTVLLNKLPYSDGFINVYNWAKASPSITLFFVALFGISDGAAPLLSYNYTQGNNRRVKETYYWTLFISFMYSIIIYVIVALLAKYFIKLLYVPEGRTNDVIKYIRINMLRMVFYSFCIGGMLLFRGTNNIKMSIFICALESFITLWFVMGACVGIGFILYGLGVSKNICALMVSVGFSVNALTCALIVQFISSRWLKKTLPNIGYIRKSWSKKIEDQFFENAIKIN